MSDALDRYAHYQRELPKLFGDREHLVLELDSAQQQAFERQHGIALGVVHETPFLVTVADLVCDPTTGRRYCYTRIVQPGAVRGGHGVVVIPQMPDGRFVLIEQERHATGQYHIEFPRGVAEPGVTPEDLARIELSEEIGVEASTTQTLGASYPDNGILATCVSFVLARVAPGTLPRPMESQIRRTILYTIEELRDAIRSGEINDGFTVQALTWLSLATPP